MAMDIKPENRPDIGLDMPDNLKPSIDKPKKRRARGGKGGKIIMTLVIIIILVVAGYLINQYTSINLFGITQTSKAKMSYNQNSYYAVFLSNGQVYFGKISSDNKDFTILQDVYYLQVSNPLQQVPPSATEQQPQLTLVKLGNELHGPQDYMKINNKQIVFIEELKNDSRVVQAIMQYKANNQAAQ
jgi:hypothetical protein